MAAIDLPEGISPSCQDVAFLPGSVFTRPALARVYSAAALAAPINYVKTFLKGNGDPFTLSINGIDPTGLISQLYAEDVQNAFGTRSLIANLPKGTIARSTTIDNAEFFAFSDGNQGTGIPTFYDGTNYARSGQDGPGAPVNVSDYTGSIFINSISEGAGASIQSISQSGNVVTVLLAFGVQVESDVQVGDLVQISGVPVAGYNGTQTITSISGGTFHFTLFATGLAPASSGTIAWGLATVVTTAPNNLLAQSNITITGNTVAAYNNSWIIRKIYSNTTFSFYIGTFGNGFGSGGTISTGGSISAGVHQCVVIFQTFSGYLTKPSPAFLWNAGGNLQANVTNIPLGPPNTVARILAFTQSGGAKFFYIPVTTTLPSLTGGAPTIIQSTVIPDNVTNSAIINFSDATLATSLAIDIPGNNLFALNRIPPAVGVFQYANRTVYWGIDNEVTNFINMDLQGGLSYAFIGGPPVPMGWVAGTNGTLITGGITTNDFAWQITGAGNTVVGELTQNAATDSFGQPIILPKTSYQMKLWIQAQVASQAGEIVIDITDGTNTIEAVVQLNTCSTAGGFVTATFNNPSWGVIGPTTHMNVYGFGLTAGQTAILGRIGIIYASQPVNTSDLIISYINNPQSFDGVTGRVSPGNPQQPIRGCFELRDQLYIIKDGSLYLTSDNGTTEPSGWTLQQVSASIGAMSFRAFDEGEDWEVIGDKSGAYMFAGGQPLKISQEVQNIWNTINPAAYNTVWVKNDRTQRRIYFGLPTGSATSPNIVLVCDYRELKASQDITYSDPVHISYSGKVLSTDLSRKWSVWNIKANCGEIITRQNGVQEMVFGGAAGTGLSSGGFDNLYSLNSAKYTDDDYGQILSFYTTYFFLPKQMQQQLQMAGLNLYNYLRMFISGIGNLQMTYFGNSLTNPWPLPPALPLPTTATQDFELGLNVQTERMAIEFAVTPLAGQTDAYFSLSKATLAVRPAVIGVRSVF